MTTQDSFEQCWVSNTTKNSTRVKCPEYTCHYGSRKELCQACHQQMINLDVIPMISVPCKTWLVMIIYFNTVFPENIMYPQNIMIWELILKFLQMILKFYLTQYGLSLYTKIYKPDTLASPNASHMLGILHTTLETHYNH